MASKILKLSLVVLILSVSACVVSPDYYGGGPPPPRYGYYGYGPAYPWNTGVRVDIGNGYGHGGYYGHGGGWGRGYGGGGWGGHR